MPLPWLCMWLSEWPSVMEPAPKLIVEGDLERAGVDAVLLGPKAEPTTVFTVEAPEKHGVLPAATMVAAPAAAAAAGSFAYEAEEARAEALMEPTAAAAQAAEEDDEVAVTVAMGPQACWAVMYW
mmetsp:Transcript_53317/g.116772  ORF Transcript_53317/g.116772 Transcript_53317/m.116772 type:complete len:125 (-) Transcript_53317:453-827(-)